MIYFYKYIFYFINFVIDIHSISYMEFDIEIMLYLHLNNIYIEVHRFDTGIDRNIKIKIDIDK